MKVQELILLLETKGWLIVSTRNGHKIFKYPSSSKTISISGKLNKEVPEQVMKNIIRIAESIDSDISTISNSADYYKTHLSKLQSEFDKLTLERTKITTDSKKPQTTQDYNNPIDLTALSDNQAKKIQEIDLTLIKISNELKQLSLLKEKKEQTEDAQTTWATKIKTAFADLAKCLSPMIKEHKRLSILFYVYAVLSAIIVLLIIAFAGIICAQLFQETPNKELVFLKYLPFYFPIPISGGLLWAFIFQMNRAQRQLVVIADKIHHIKYVEGLLLALNSLSLNIDTSALKINETINRIIDNHLNISINIEEDNLKKEEGKDSLPIDSIINLLKEFKELTKKD